MTPPKCAAFSSPNTCGPVTIPDSDLATEVYYPASTSTPVTMTGGTGRANTDMIIYVQSVQTSTCPASGSTSGTIAYASSCQYDTYGRPTVGYINFCPGMMSTDSSKFQEQLATAVHEITHSLGFSSSLFPTYRDVTTGKVRSGVTTTANVRGKTVTQVSTPSVTDVVKQHFGCSSLTGAELEDQGGSGTAGSHWEKLLFGPEYMTGVTTGAASVYSALTFALLQDSGWYQVSSQYDPLVYGRNKGCNFVNNKCVSAGVSSDASTFCTSASTIGCTVSRDGWGPCSMATYSANLPSQFQYFSNLAQGGSLQVNDYCPTISSYSNKICSNSANMLTANANSLGESYAVSGKPSKCFASSLTATGFSSKGSAGCYQYNCKCTSGVTSIDVTVCSDSTQCVTKTCTSPGSTLTFTGYTGAITCPQPLDICVKASDYSSGSGSCAIVTSAVITSLTGGSVATTAASGVTTSKFIFCFKCDDHLCAFTLTLFISYVTTCLFATATTKAATTTAASGVTTSKLFFVLNVTIICVHSHSHSLFPM